MSLSGHYNFYKCEILTLRNAQCNALKEAVMVSVEKYQNKRSNARED